MSPKKFTQADVRRWITEGFTEVVAELRNGTNNTTNTAHQQNQANQDTTHVPNQNNNQDTTPTTQDTDNQQNNTVNTNTVSINNVNTNTTPAGCTYKTFLSCETHSFNGTEGPVGLTRWFEKLEFVFRISGCRDADRTKFASCKLSDGTLTWWNTYPKSVGMDQAFETSWEDLKQPMIEEYCPYNETVKMEWELQNLKLVGTDLTRYNKRFFKLALMCPNMVTPECRKITLYVKGLIENIQGGATTSKPRTVQEAVEMAHELMDQIEERGKAPAAIETKTYDNKRKWNNRNNNFGKNYNQQPYKKQDTAKGNTATPNTNSDYKGRFPLCAKCNRHHPSDCIKKCDKCKKNGHLAAECKAGSNMCYGYGKAGHFKKDCPTTSKSVEPARGRAFNINSSEARDDPKLVTENLYSIELGNGNLMKTDKVYRDCTWILAGTTFRIDMILIKLESFDLVVGMDWLAENRADIVCHQKAICIPVTKDEPLMVYGE
ncbi:uncharacterized protein [Rutidosis leptorrhynchoides]|uniref:uncharacterized protein n=1 Tax=Rutidosis leptorrhynchoides TaxID=125765 RepID=UPI003A994CC7